MTIRSKLFATVAFPMLSMSIAIQPALADSLMKPFEVAQEDGIAQEGGEQVPEELLRKKRKQRAEQQEQQEQQSEEAQPSQEEQPSRAERRKKRQEAEQQQEQQPSADDEAARQAAEEKQRIRAERKKRQQAEQEQQEEAQPSADDEAAKAAEERAKIRAERKKRQQAEQQQQEEAQPSADDEAAKAAEERAKIRAERKKRQQAEQQQQEEAQPSADDEAAKAAEERAKIRAERKKRQQAEQEQQEEAQPSADDEAAKTAEERAKIRAERRKRQQAEGQQQEEGQQPAAEDALRPAIDGDAEATETPRKRRDRRQPIPEIVDTRSEEEKQEIARDPAATDDTVVLPVEKGAAVLDSDKDADNAGDEGVREKRRKRREQARAQEENVEVPKSDEEAQSSRRDRRPTQEELGANIREEGRRVERVPEFNANDLIDAFTGNDSSRRPRIDETRDNRTVLDFGDQIIVRGDDRPRLRRNAQETYYEELSRGRSREVIERPNGVRIITIYNRYGDIVQRSRIDRDGREYLMIYAPEVDEGPRPRIYDVGEDLPPMRLRVPVRDYIIDTSSEPDRDYYDFLAEPPVEQVERVYSIDEVRNSARIRDKVRRIDLDTITFATGSAEVPLSQAKTLRKVADAMLQVIEKDPGETFFIEGHTDAVGSDESNLVLSDERAESVASLLTEVYDIPAENLVTQGYGERFLKVRTLEAEQENRRVTIRRVTPLVRPVAQN
ncbi:OmpA family protein [Rhizobium giardinii]|uniref:Outer membrane protein OmpA-like peptidoglycan-associated protein n=2 Tax=Rhizobium giardinii TaxID=56731 RepID=A0A7W8U9S7_9HYPH|nr:OmpA family protein [Rhizobium giardinii]MBB5534819.1 outer membrane protein OmpA-like peptidoglycan-associated protein [Rhizobium giardinii]